LLTICLANEPVSLFLYADGSVAARSVRQAIYDGPFDVLDFDHSPVILAQKPGAENGDAFFETVSVKQGDQIVDANGNLVNLAEGVIYTPSGCRDAACAMPYTGGEIVQIDQFVVRFRLLPGIQWSDGAPLTADDSVYSFEITQELYPRLRPDLIARTASYQALDESTLEWRGVPGYRRADYATYFFSPLPRHAWGQLSLDELLTADITNRTPMGWGPYVIDEWTSGDHISLSRNPNYFRSVEGLPGFDKLVFRFIGGRDQALDALLAGECDYLDESFALETEQARMLELRDAGKIALAVETGTSWEQLAFGIVSLDSTQPPLFQTVEMRQAFAQCVNRERLVQDLFLGQSFVPDTYVHPAHPLANPDVRRYAFDPAAAATLLERLGWLDEDGNPATPRLATGVSGVPDGTPLALALLTTDEPHKQQAAQILRESLAECGIALEVNAMPWETLLASGPEGLIFGRRFTLAQYGWISALYPPCPLYTTAEIPGPYPAYPKGWGGANASGYSNPDYDRACLDALAAMPETPEYRASHHQAQQIYAEQIPSVPLYVHLKMIATRPDMCGLQTDPSADSALWNLENLNYGEACE
jgi:peptide/nickel transport system substrate-binding protein